MREIKFRAWLPDKGHFNRCNVHIDGTGLLFWQFAQSCGVIHKETRDKIVLQWSTGLYDKNSKEIYEGDIVKYHDLASRFQIKWYQFGFHFAWGDGMISMPVTHPEFYEVIGNVYENPELLKEVK